MFVSGAIANHISKIYQILSGSGESGNVDKKRKIILTWKYHDRNNKLIGTTVDAALIIPLFKSGSINGRINSIDFFMISLSSN